MVLLLSRKYFFETVDKNPKRLYIISMVRRTRAYRRSHRNRIINRKVHILKQFGGENYVFAWSRGNAGRFAKGKIHCSCWMCRAKSYDILSHTDRKKLMAVRQQMNERY
jgi:hypothetical protein